MKRVRIFVSSPNDVTEERNKARQVIDQLQRYYGDRLTLEAVFWEDLPLQADASFQEGVDLVLSSERGIDIAVFILWSRLGSPLGGVARKRDGTPYRSGTEREFDLMLAALQQSKQSGRPARPDILAYTRNDDTGFRQRLARAPRDEIEQMIVQQKLAESFIREHFHDETGANIRAYHTYPAPVSFAERLKVHLRGLLDAGFDREAALTRWSEPPYQGLEVFDIVHAPIFHGREEEIARLSERLRVREAQDGCAFVVIVGASGSGKSSLARAGVAANLLNENLDDAIRQWRCATFIPGTTRPAEKGALFRGLARALAADGALPELRAQVADLADLGSELEKNPDGAVKLVLRPAFKTAEQSVGGAVYLLLVFDQMEELYTDRRLTADGRARFFDAIEALARSGSVRVLATLRSDFYPLAQLDETFLRLKGDQGHFDLLPPGPAALRALIVEPARFAGLRFDSDEVTGRTLADWLLEDTLRQRDALPLLEYTLRELYEQRSSDQRLTFDAYKAMGRLSGAIGKRAEAVFTALPGQVQAAFDETLWSLVSVSPDAEPVRRRAALPTTEDASPRAVLVRTFIRERFFTADHAAGQPTVSLAHEALLRSWPRLSDWISQNRDLLRIRRRVEEAAQLWREKNEHADYLLAPGLPLAEAEALLNRRRDAVEKGTTEFIRKSIYTAEAKKRTELTRLRRRNVILTVAAAAATLFGAIALVSYQRAGNAKLHTEMALRETQRTLSQSDFLQALPSIDEDKDLDALAQLARSLSYDRNNDAAAFRLGTLLTYRDYPIPLFDVKHEGAVDSAQFSPDGKRIVTASEDKTARVWDAETGKPLGEPMKHEYRVYSAQFSPDGKRIVTNSDRVWDGETGKPLTYPRIRDALTDAMKRDGHVWSSTQVSPDTKRILTISRKGQFGSAVSDCTARIWDAETGKPLGEPMNLGEPTKDTFPIMSAQFSPDGRRIVTVSQHEARIWDAENGKPLTDPMKDENKVRSAQFSPDGKRIVTISQDGTARVWDAETGKPLTEPMQHEDKVQSAQFSPDGKRIVKISQDGTARVWDAETGKPLAEPMKTEGIVRLVQFSPDGKRIATALWPDNTARVWDAETGKPLTEPMKDERIVSSVRFSPDGKRIVSVSDRTARVWDIQTGKTLTEPMKHSRRVFSAQFNPDGKRIVTASFDRTARVWDAQSGKLLTESMKHDGSVNSAQFSPNGKRIVTASGDKTARVWDAETGKPLGEPMKHDGSVNSAQFSPDGKRIVTASGDQMGPGGPAGESTSRTSGGHAARVWDAETGKPLTESIKHDGHVWSVQFSPDSKRILTASGERKDRLRGTARVWDAETGKPLTELMKHDSSRGWLAAGGHPVVSAQFSPDNRRIVTASSDFTARVWDAETGKALTEPMEHMGHVTSARFSPDGRRIVTASGDHTARVWDAETGKPLTEPMKHRRTVELAQFSPDGKRIVTTSYDGTARIWDAETGEPLTEPMKHAEQVYSAQFSPDGKRIVTASLDTTARVWDLVPHDTPPAWLSRLSEAIAGQHLNERGVFEPLREDPAQVLNEIKEQLSHEPVDNDWAVWGRWFLADRSTRTISPFSKITVPEYIENRIKDDTVQSLDEAEELAIGNPGLLQRITKAREALVSPH